MAVGNRHRETAVRVAAGAIAKKWLRERHGVEVRGYLSRLGPIAMGFRSWDGVGANPFFSADPDAVAELEAFMDGLRKSGDSVGAQVTVVASGVPVGWGEPVDDKLDADIAYAITTVRLNEACRAQEQALAWVSSRFCLVPI